MSCNFLLAAGRFGAGDDQIFPGCVTDAFRPDCVFSRRWERAAPESPIVGPSLGRDSLRFAFHDDFRLLSGSIVIVKGLNAQPVAADPALDQKFVRGCWRC